MCQPVFRTSSTWVGQITIGDDSPLFGSQSLPADFHLPNGARQLPLQIPIISFVPLSYLATAPTLSSAFFVPTPASSPLAQCLAESMNSLQVCGLLALTDPDCFGALMARPRGGEDGLLGLNTDYPAWATLPSSPAPVRSPGCPSLSSSSDKPCACACALAPGLSHTPGNPTPGGYPPTPPTASITPGKFYVDLKECFTAPETYPMPEWLPPALPPSYEAPPESTLSLAPVQVRKPQRIA
ncbi:hypothetical protein PAPYR_1539 [Paratrimastix pyriformis]|uniref:Uncharacterized protein n=1 Tax=Paratrimastix pyriformis TaxID=342808 RepID=A0ABQ8URV6_9EUKA|nr:hypothetical protein PAPYR_1539 [Paratrimastix pyriformis]